MLTLHNYRQERHFMLKNNCIVLLLYLWTKPKSREDARATTLCTFHHLSYRAFNRSTLHICSNFKLWKL